MTPSINHTFRPIIPLPNTPCPPIPLRQSSLSTNPRFFSEAVLETLKILEGGKPSKFPDPSSAKVEKITSIFTALTTPSKFQNRYPSAAAIPPDSQSRYPATPPIPPAKSQARYATKSQTELRSKISAPTENSDNEELQGRLSISMLLEFVNQWGTASGKAAEARQEQRTKHTLLLKAVRQWRAEVSYPHTSQIEGRFNLA